MFTPALPDQYIIWYVHNELSSDNIWKVQSFLFTVWDQQDNMRSGGKSKQMHFLTPKAGMRISPCFSCFDQLNNWIKNIWIKKKPLCSYFWAFRQKNDWGGVCFVWLISGENNLRSTIKLKIEYQEQLKIVEIANL